MLAPSDSSFRDPSGYVYRGDNGILYRSVSQAYKPTYEHLIKSGLYQSLVEKGWLVQHEEIHLAKTSSAVSYTLKPVELPFISYPYEWSFGQLKDAALLTLEIQLEALKYNLTLKDASAYNVTFYKDRPIFLDTLSFEQYNQDQPWIAYKQFCQHFLAPLALAAYRSPELIKLLQSNIDGIPLSTASKLLPTKSYMSLGMLLHLHLHAKAQQKLSQTKTSSIPKHAASQQSVMHLVSNLKSAVKNLNWQPDKTVWASYYTENNNYSDASMQHKAQLVEEFLTGIATDTIWDVGANTGKFSRIASNYANQVIATDFDYGAVELLYQQLKSEKATAIVPLVSDITNPSPSIGWFNKERTSFLQRIQPDVILALAVVHHLAIANNIPLVRIAELFASKCEYLIVEFIPKKDSQVRLMLQARKDIFSDYTEEGFEQAFKMYFDVLLKKQLSSSDRSLYLMRKR
ncbi:hypothetical protein [Pontibacter sp. H249]|uniref:hypothetical protein n=1 Tax=Pontibacter sp. H249 TaxID=3133420 RepID=UPI0030C16372